MMTKLKKCLRNCGLDETIAFLSGPELSEDDKKELEKENIFIDGFLNISFLMSLPL